MLRICNKFLLLIISNLVLIQAMDSKPPKKLLNANAPEFRPAASTTSFQPRQSSDPPVVHSDFKKDAQENLSPETVKLRELLPDDTLFDFDQWKWENVVANEDDTQKQGGSSSSDKPSIKEPGQKQFEVPDKLKEDDVKNPSSSDIVHKKNLTTANENKKGEKSDLKVSNKNEAVLAADQLMKLSLKEEVNEQSLQDKKLSEERQQKPGSSPKMLPIEITSVKMEEPVEIRFGTFSNDSGSGLARIVGHQNAAQIEQAMDQPFVDKNKQREVLLTNVGQKEVEHQHQQQQSSSSSGKIEKKAMMVEEKGMKPNTQVSMERHVQVVQWKKQQEYQLDSPPLARKGISPRYEIPAKRRGGQAQWIHKKKQSPSSSLTASSPVASSSPLSVASSVPTSPSTISSTTTGTIQRKGSSSKVLENKFDLLAKEVESQEKEDIKNVPAEEAGGKSETYQEGSASGKSAKSVRKKKKAEAGTSTGGKVKVKSKKEEDEEKKFLEFQRKRVAAERKLREQERKQLIEQLSNRVDEELNHQSHSKQTAKDPEKETKNNTSGVKEKKGIASSESHVEAKTPNKLVSVEQEWQELEVPLNGLVVQIVCLQRKYELCQRTVESFEKGQEMRQLNKAYLAVLRKVEHFVRDFVLKCGEKYGKPRSSYIGDILQWIGQIYPTIDENKVDEFQHIVRDSLVYLDSNGGLTPQFQKPGEQQQQNILDDLFENISKLDGPIANYEMAKNKGKGGAEKAAELVEECYERDVDNKLREVIGYLYIDVKKKQGVDGRANKITFDQTINCLARFRSLLSNRTDQIFAAIRTICKLFNLPNFRLRRSNTSSGRIEAMISQHIQPCVSDSAGSSGSSSHQTLTSNTATFESSGSTNSISFKKSMTPEKLLEKMHKAPIELDPIVVKVNQLQFINDNCTNINSKLEILGNIYKELMKELENFTNIYGNKYNWNGNIYFGAIFTWIDTTFEMVEGIEMPKDPKAIMHKSLVLLDKHGITNFEQLLEDDVTEINKILAEYHSKLYENHEISEEESLELFKKMDIYMTTVDTNLREALSFQFIGMSGKNVERMRKSVAKLGLFSLSMALRGEKGMPGHREGQFQLAQQTLDLFFDIWTAGLETLIRADLPKYVEEVLWFKKENAKEKAVKISFNLEQLADESIKIDAQLQHKGNLTIIGNKLQVGLNAISELLDNSWEPTKQSLGSGSSSSSSKKGKNIRKGKVKADKAKEEGMLSNPFNWKLVFENVRTLIRYIRMLTLLQNFEGRVNKKVDGFHVRVRVWAILFKDKITPILDEWNHNLKNQTFLKDQEEGNMKQYLEFLAKTMGKFLAENGQSKKGEQIKAALEILVILEQIHAMEHRNKHLSRLLANDPSKDDGDELIKDDEDDHFKNCKQFDYLLQD